MQRDGDLVLAIYAGVTSDAALEAMLAILAQRFNCVSSALFFVDARRRDATITLAHGVLAQATVRRLYLNEFAALDPAPAEMARLSLGDAASTDDLFRGDDLVKHTRFLEGFYYRVGLGGALGGPLANSKGRVGMVAVQRSRPQAQGAPGGRLDRWRSSPMRGGRLRIRYRCYDRPTAFRMQVLASSRLS